MATLHDRRMRINVLSMYFYTVTLKHITKSYVDAEVMWLSPSSEFPLFSSLNINLFFVLWVRNRKFVVQYNILIIYYPKLSLGHCKILRDP